MAIPQLGRPIILANAHVKAYLIINKKIELINM